MTVELSDRGAAPRLPRVRFLAPDLHRQAEPAERPAAEPARTAPVAPLPDPAPEPEPEPAPPAPVAPARPAERSRRRPPRAVIAAVPVLAVNACAFLGQLGYLRAHLLAWGLPGQVLVAFTLESIAVYLSYHAHVARLADDAAFRIQAAATVIALVIGAMNYSHWAGPSWTPTPIAITFALMSVLSPWLWGTHSRRESRDALKAKGLIEPHAVRLGANRWFWYPVRSAKVTRLAAWQGVTVPTEAIALHVPKGLPATELDAEALAALSPRDRLVVAFGAVGAIDVPRALALLEQHGAAVDQSHAYQIRKALTAGKDAGS